MTVSNLVGSGITAPVACTWIALFSNHIIVTLHECELVDQQSQTWQMCMGLVAQESQKSLGMGKSQGKHRIVYLADGPLLITDSGRQRCLPYPWFIISARPEESVLHDCISYHPNNRCLHIP